ncbi:MAG: NAD-dependent succinate-semialdehyde dehydrogenase [Aphanocapsa sp. GSE-SYN-MK-11-07L]|jgi:succinate-semialdehyde dehydrogenase/glutarate-semialdehyde dehydrogenase|nr:NAD-dependent succinate-semialdehyde dehydrogenase [Aphanocapsa sp. GSE-SYN-MK-11-07L]
MAIASVSPTTGATLKTFTPLTDAELEARLALAQKTFEQYQRIPLAQRCQWLAKAAEILVANREEYGKLITLEMGKPIAEAIAEVEKSALVCRYYAENAEALLADVLIESDTSRSFIRYQPLGAILAVMPWNFPFWQVFRFAAPALALGNVGLLKHASNVPQSALAIQDIFTEAGLPSGTFQTLLIGAERVAELIADDRIKAATLTGSEPAGASLAAAAGKQIKKTVMELGGSDPFVVMPSADLEAAVTTAAKARMINNGQSCVAAKRFIVAEAIADQFEQRLVEQFQALRVGDPLQPDTQLGPLATAKILQDLDRQVQTALEKGARVLTGGQSLVGSTTLPPELRQGNFYPATILTDIHPLSPAYTEEFFGPVALLLRVPDLDAAIQIANATPFGLAASGWTTVAAESDRLINELAAGAVFINGMVKSDPRLPFGGIKRSGYGRELGSHGLYEFANIKTVWVK